jgi:hypothetical protein
MSPRGGIERTPARGFAWSKEESETKPRNSTLRAAVDIGAAAFDRGDFKKFPSAVALVDYLKKVGAAAMSGSKGSV